MLSDIKQRIVSRQIDALYKLEAGITVTLTSAQIIILLLCGIVTPC